MANDTIILNLDQPKQKQMLIGWIKALKGVHRVKIAKVRKHRSLNQNAYYWGVVIPHVIAGIEEAWGETLDPEALHEWMKAKFIPLEPIVNRKTGELMGKRVASSAALTTTEFADYLDRIIKFAAEYLGVEIPPAESFENPELKRGKVMVQ